jgi:hypothetical protein
MKISTKMNSRPPRLKVLGLCVGLAVVLAACSNVKESMGLNKRAPDEFTVVSKAPLILPPDYNLRPPKPGVPRPTELTPVSEARATVFGNSGGGSGVKRKLTPQEMAIAALNQSNQPSAPKSAGEIAMLGHAGADPSQANIRNTIRRETTGVSFKPKSLADRLLFWKKDPTEGGMVIDAGKEAKRLKKLAAEGRPASITPAPVIRRKKQILLEDLE